MPTTIIGPSAADFPAITTPPIVQIKRAWGDSWQTVPELKLVQARWAAAGQDLSGATFSRPYGMLKHPWETTIGTHASANLDRYWVRILFASGRSVQPVWIGRIAGEGSDLFGSAAQGPSGVQTWQAYGPSEILRKISISKSWWSVGSEVKECGWVPTVNDRDERGWIRGNRAATPGSVYFYGGTDVWTHRQYAEYLLAMYVDESFSSPAGPSWTLGGQAELLETLQETIRLGESATVDQVLKMLIPPRLGIDWTVMANDSGFVVWVYSLQAEECSYGGVTLPKNPNTVRIKTSESVANLRTSVALTDDQVHGRIRVLGKRMTVCLSVRGLKTMATEPAAWAGSLAKKWTQTLEDEYLAGTGTATDPPEKHDHVRAGERFRGVFQLLAAPDDWDHNAGTAAPKLNDSGELVAVGQEGAKADYQQTVRATLSWTPLKQGYDYSVNPPENKNPPDWPEPDYQPPLVFLSARNWEDSITWGAPLYVMAETAGIGISVLRKEWGVLCQASPNHLLAHSYWGPTAAASHKAPLYDYEMIVATIAIEGDQRMALKWQTADWKISDGTMDIEVPDAECWILAPHTVVGIDKEGLLKTSGPDHIELRNDSVRLAAVMVAAIARYGEPRSRAAITISGLLPWSLLVGQILTVIDEGGNTHRIQAPITSVEWIAGEGDNPGQTIVNAGYAQG